MHNTRPARTRDRLRPFPPPAAWFLAALGCLGCATLGQQGRPLVPTRYETRTGPYAVFTNSPIKADAPGVRSLQALEDDIEATLGVHARAEEPSIKVYILDDRQSFTHFLKFYYPELPPRRAFFLAQGTERVVYTFMGDRLEEDLRHEATHALLNVAVGDLPLWLDEGLAEYFEGPEGRFGRNAEHLGRLPQDRASGWAPDLARLETLKGVGQMAPRDYRESWAWVHYLLNHSGATKAALLGYLADLHTSPARTPPLSERLKGTDTTPASLLAHIDRVRTAPIAAAAPANPPAATAARADPTVRLQDNALIEPARPGPSPSSSPPRRNAFDRVRTLLGLD
jgi:hypothetical protein